MAEAIELLLKLFYLSVAMIIYTLFNLFASARAFHKNKDMPGKWLGWPDWCCILSELKRIMKQMMNPIQRFSLLI